MKEDYVLFRLSKKEKEELLKRSQEHHISMSAYIRLKTLTNN